MIKSLFALCLFSTAVFAQNAAIGLPLANQTVGRGESLVVQVQQPDSLAGTEEVAVVVGIQSCPNRPCASPSSNMGWVVYNGPFTPHRHEQDLPPYQNISVKVPNWAAEGAGLVGVAHVGITGAGRYVFLETLNQTITIV